MLHLVPIVLFVTQVPPVAPQEGATQPEKSWLAAAQAEVQRSEYRFQAVLGEPGVWSAPNRGQELRSRVSAEGLEVFARSASADGIGAPWKLRLATTSFGRTDGAFALPPAAVSVAEVRVELDHGHLVEWFVNDARGIEQGWDVPYKPVGSGELWIGLALEGDLALRIEDGARSGVLVDACGDAVLRYRDLRVFDAAGRELPAWLRSSQLGVGIAVDDAGASYPLTVDPVLTGPAWTAEGDQEAAFFGYSIASAGDVNADGYSDVIVGSRLYDNGQTDEGRAYVYLGSSSGLSTSPAWTAESDQAGAVFGSSVASAGDVNADGYSDVIVGASFYDNGQSEEGRAYVYMGSSSGLSTSPAWTTEGDQLGAFYGESVATAGDVNADGYSDVVVGARGYDNGQTDEGRAYIYMGSSSGLSISPAWTGESDQASANYGFSVATAGDVNSDGYSDVILSALLYSNGQTEEGRAYVYVGSSSGLSMSPAWTAESDQALARYGSSVATAGDVNADGYSDVIVGSRGYSNGQSHEGRAFVYLGSSSGLSMSPAWMAENDQANAAYGSSVATAGDVNSDGYSDVIVAAFFYDNGQTDEGRVYVYLGSSSVLSMSPAWTAESDQAFAHFSSATAGDVNGDGYSDVILGSDQYTNGQTEEGRAYVYHGSPSGLSAPYYWLGEQNQAGANYGTSVASAGDLNGDGYGDVVVGAPLYDNGQSDEGLAFVYAGSSAGPALTPSWTLEVNQAGAEFGHSVASAGDVNGDGYGDVIVGAHLYDNVQTDEGWAFVYLGSPSGLPPTPSWSAESDEAMVRFAISAASAGDVNGDGYGDVIIGAADNATLTVPGQVYVYEGSPSGLAATPAWVVQEYQASSLFGFSVAGAGDVNGDGYGDVVVGAYLLDNGELNEGGAYAYLGSPAGLATSPAWTVESDGIWAEMGFSVAGAGDVNGDGYSDVIVGAYTYESPDPNEGRAYVYLGSSAGLSTSPAWTADGNQANGVFAVSVASAGDVNADGYGDVVVGQYAYDGGQTDEGRGLLYLGSASGLATSAAWTVESNQTSALLGGSVASAGDVNGDGYSDVIIGAWQYDDGQTDEGRAWIWYGNEGYGGLVRKLQQRTRNGARPIAVVGSSGPSGLFRIRCEFTSQSAGYSWASPAAPVTWLEWEIKPHGVPFDGTAIQRGEEYPLVPAALVVFDELASVDDAAGHARTTEARSYHWRARVATNSPLFPNTAWFSVQGSNLTEAKLRKPQRESP